MSEPSFDQIVAGLVATGTERPNAERLARRKLGIAEMRDSAIPQKRALPPMIFQLIVPWSHLISDNDKYGVTEGRMLITSRYRKCKAAIAQLARTALGDVEPWMVPLSLVATVWVPDNRPHDVANFGKCVHDALEGVLYAKDQWLHRVTWERAGVDVDAPRASLTVSPLAPDPAGSG